MKKYGVLLSVLLIAGNINADGKDMAYAAAALLGAGVAQYGAKKLSNNQLVRNVGNSVGINPVDVGRVAALSGGLLAISCIADKGLKDGLIAFAWRAPVAALVVGVTQTRAFQEIAQNVPVVGACVTCDDENCQGTCNQCKLTKNIISLGVWRMVDEGLTQWLSKKTTTI
jgi:hypothetical protein